MRRCSLLLRGPMTVRRIGRDSNILSEVPDRPVDRQADDAADQESGDAEPSNSEELTVHGGANSGYPLPSTMPGA